MKNLKFQRNTFSQVLNRKLKKRQKNPKYRKMRSLWIFYR
nr:MAG TPA: hypothetical protein [Caudoviricetes sp.]